MLFINSFLDYPVNYQLGFQASASFTMRLIIELHNHIMFFLIIILVMILIMLYIILLKFSISTFDIFLIYLKVKKLYNIKITHNTTLETLWIIFPTIILYTIAISSFTLLYSLDINPKTFLNLKVMGHQWYWSYEVEFWMKKTFQKNELFKNMICGFSFDSYMVSTNELSKNGLRLLETTCPIVLPIKTPIRVLVSASDVLHSWAIPSLGIKIDAVPGRINEVILFIDRIGHFYGQCSELCGVNHGFMPIEIFAITKDEFMLDYIPTACVSYSILKLKTFLYMFHSEWVDLIFKLIDDKKLKDKFSSSNIEFLRLSVDKVWFFNKIIKGNEQPFISSHPSTILNIEETWIFYNFKESDFEKKWPFILEKTEEKLLKKLINNVIS